MKPFEQQTYYEILEVPVTAPLEEIRAAYERLMELYSPDSIAVYALVDEGQVDGLRARMAEALEILSDEELRAEYDKDLGLPARRLMDAAASGGEVPPAEKRAEPERVGVAATHGDEQTGPRSTQVPQAGTDGRPGAVRDVPVEDSETASTERSGAEEGAARATEPRVEPLAAVSGQADFRASFFRGFSFAYVSSSLQDAQRLGSAVDVPAASIQPRPDSGSATGASVPASSGEAAAPTTATVATVSAPAPVSEPAAAPVTAVSTTATLVSATEAPAAPAAAVSAAAPAAPVSAPAPVEEAPVTDPVAPAADSPPAQGAPAGVAPAPSSSAPASGATPAQDAPVSVASGPSTSAPDAASVAPPAPVATVTPPAPASASPAPGPESTAIVPVSPTSTQAEQGRPVSRPGRLGDAPQLAQDSAIATAEAALAQVSQAASRAREPRPRIPDIPSDAEFNGELLRQVREARGMTLQQVADRTRISRGHLENVEADRYNALPAAVYLRGILMNLARELGLDPLRVSKSYLALSSEKSGKK
ncbi:helix-turn-helix domain-containing protein [Corallococcus macrosporus]|uniref:DnaJ domain-containing protein n=1 Tax=Myxococcus fulvus (strain ATCC BAA-855 / HW-1) TaxID=483219 RepID=F8CRQ1_MYXFH|nr:helix-turn-helix domain-containing protein [Corallococcus macrosporus]AEI66799.1 DnaJ domain-containing protein [Corallococcus macrosporus]